MGSEWFVRWMCGVDMHATGTIVLRVVWSLVVDVVFFFCRSYAVYCSRREYKRHLQRLYTFVYFVRVCLVEVGWSM